MQKGNFDIISISADKQAVANVGFGYLFRHHDLAAKLGMQFGADWVVVGQHSKPSFLYSYLMSNLVQVKTGNLVSRFDIELKGNHAKVTQYGVEALADKIVKTVLYPKSAAQNHSFHLVERRKNGLFSSVR